GCGAAGFIGTNSNVDCTIANGRKILRVRHCDGAEANGDLLRHRKERRLTGPLRLRRWVHLKLSVSDRPVLASIRRRPLATAHGLGSAEGPSLRPDTFVRNHVEHAAHHPTKEASDQSTTGAGVQLPTRVRPAQER